MIYATPVYATVAALLVGQLLFPYRWRSKSQHTIIIDTWHEQQLPWHSKNENDKVADHIPPGDVRQHHQPDAARRRRRGAVRTRGSRSGSSRRAGYYPRILASAAFPIGVDPSASRIANKFGNIMAEKAGNTTSIDVEPRVENTASPQITVPPPKISQDCVPDVHAMPTCNSVHERSMDDALVDQALQSIHFGGTRNVWRVFEHLTYHPGAANAKSSSPTSQPSTYALKTLRWKRSFDEQTYRLQQKEAAALDHLTGASGVVTLHGYCATTLQSEYANRDTLAAFLKKSAGRTHRILPLQLLQIAWRLAEGVASLHAERGASRGGGGGGGGGLRIIHRDLDASNIMLTKNNTDGTWDVRLDDFNQAYILKYRDSHGEVCSYHDEFVCGDDGRRVDVRAPEECYDVDKVRPFLSEKVDVYGLGVVLYYILTHRRAYNLDEDAPGSAKDFPLWYRKRVLEGGYPQLPKSIEADQDGAIRSIVEAMKMAMMPDADSRDSAQNIADYLLGQLREYVREQKYSYSKGGKNVK